MFFVLRENQNINSEFGVLVSFADLYLNCMIWCRKLIHFGDLVQKVPARRAGNVDDLAGVVLFLVSKAGAYVEGRSIAVDGGRTLFANGQI